MMNGRHRMYMHVQRWWVHVCMCVDDDDAESVCWIDCARDRCVTMFMNDGEKRIESDGNDDPNDDDDVNGSVIV